MDAGGGRWADRFVRRALVDPEQLLAHPKNFRIHGMTQQLALEDSLDELGWIDEVHAQDGADVVFDGHLRVALALRRGELVPVNYYALTDAETDAALAYKDPIAALAGTDADKLDELMGELTTQSQPLLQMLADLQARETEAAQRAAGAAEPEVRISPEILERQDYLVFTFANELDWRAACEAFDVGTVYERHPDDVRKGAQSANKGIGRVIHGARLVAKLRAVQGDAE